MNTIILNIGLHIGPNAVDGHVDVKRLLDALHCTNVERATVHVSNTEPTLVVEARDEARDIEGAFDRIASFLCGIAKQEAIAYTIDGVGYMAGPKAAEWGPFNPEYFILPNGERMA